MPNDDEAVRTTRAGCSCRSDWLVKKSNEHSTCNKASRYAHFRPVCVQVKTHMQCHPKTRSGPRVGQSHSWHVLNRLGSESGNATYSTTPTDMLGTDSWGWERAARTDTTPHSTAKAASSSLPRHGVSTTVDLGSRNGVPKSRSQQPSVGGPWRFD
jgi:hypothetical protein